MSFINETDFVIENKELVYPEIVTDGLQLYYDAKGKRDNDYHRDTMLDMSGNGNHGELHNFAYEKFSGYRDGLVFDGIDDKLVLPDLDIPENNFTFQLNGNIISFSPDGTVKRVQDGEVIESKGFNLVENGDFSNGTNSWTVENNTSVKQTTNGVEIISINDQGQMYQFVSGATIGDIVYTAILAKSDTPSNYVLSTNQGGVALNSSNTDYQLVSIREKRINNPVMSISRYGLGDGVLSSIYLKYMVCINLTKTFGAGNEPTKEQMDAIIDRMGFIPNPQDILDRREYTHNILGDMEGIIDDMDKDKVSGTEIYTDKADDSVVHVEVDGKGVGGGGGKNLIYGSEDFSMTRAGTQGNLLSEKFKGSGVFYLNFPSGSPYAQAYDQSVTANKAGYYTASFYAKSSKSGTIITNFFYSPSTTISSLTSQGNSSNAVDGTIALTLTDKWEKYWIRWQQTETSTDKGIILGRISAGINYGDVYISQPQLEEGQVATDYEPTPHPDAPVEIHSLNDFDVVSSVGRENILENSSFRENTNGWSTSTGVKRTVKDGYNCHVIESDSFGITRLVSQSIQGDLVLGKRYIVSGWLYTENIQTGPTNPTSMFYIDGFDINNNWIGMDSTSFPQNSGRWVHISYITYTVTESYATARTLTFFIHTRDITGNIYFRDLKMEPVNSVNDTHTLWTPSLNDIAEDSNHPLIDKINLLLDEPLRSVGDMKDRLFRDSDGLWKVERNVEESILSGSWGWSHHAYSTTEIDYYEVYRNLPDMGYSRKIESTHFSGTLTQHHYPVNHTRMSAAGHLSVSFKHGTFNELSEFKDWLNNNQIIANYEVLPTIEILDQELQDKLNNLRSFQDSNYVYTIINDKTDNLSHYVVDNLKPTLHARFLPADWYKEDRVVNNLMIYNRALSDEEMLQNYKTIKRRWGM